MMKGAASWEQIRSELPQDVQDRLNESMEKFLAQQSRKWIDLNVQNAFDMAKENGYDFIALGTPTEEIAIDMKDMDCNFKTDTLQDIEAAIDRYKARI